MRSAGVYQTKPNRRWNPFGSWFCRIHEVAAREEEAENEESDRLIASLRAAAPPQASPTATAEPRATDINTLPREVLEGLTSFLANSEWRFPPLKLTPTVSLGSGKNAKPERSSMGSLHDVVLIGISDLLMAHGHKIQRCAGRNCNKTFLSVRRQKFCSTGCAWQARFERFKLRLGGEEGFSELRHHYYVKSQRRKTGKPNLQVRRRILKGKQR